MTNTKWTLSPATGIEYRADQPSDYQPIQTFADIHETIMNKFKDRIRYRGKDGKMTVVPVAFNNENDRLKSNKTSPGIIIGFGGFDEVTDDVRTDLQMQRVLDENMIYVNEAPVRYEDKIKITAIATDWDFFVRFCIFLKDVMFPRVIS